MPFQKVEFEFPEDEKEDKFEIEPSSATEIDLSGKKPEKEPEPEQEAEAEDDIEIVDDTPEEDRGRTPSDPPQEVTDEELENYSEKVRKRIQHFSKGYHDERRAKETAQREREELEKLARKLMEENKTLKSSSSKTQQALLDQARQSAAAEYEAAKRSYRNAYDSGESEAVLEAQEKLTAAKIKIDRLQNVQIPPLQKEGNEVQLPTEPAEQSTPAVDPRAAQWQQDNPWFNTDDEMTSFALGIHNKLLKQGVDPKSDEYYETINSRMRQVFPDYFGEAEPPKKKSNVVAPATRSTAPKKVRLTQTQVNIAKRLGVPLQKYAEQVALEMRKANG